MRCRRLRRTIGLTRVLARLFGDRGPTASLGLSVNLSDLVADLRKVGAGELAGPCPFCGGKDRFRVWPEEGRDKMGRFWCRSCGEMGDAVDFLRITKGLSYREACEAMRVDARIQAFTADAYNAVFRNVERIILDATPEELDRLLEKAALRELDTAPTETVIRHLSSAIREQKTEKAEACVRILTERMLTLYRIVDRYAEVHPGQLRTFLKTELRTDPADLFERIGMDRNTLEMKWQ
jgi:hypothetical protein